MIYDAHIQFVNIYYQEAITDYELLMSFTDTTVQSEGIRPYPVNMIFELKSEKGATSLQNIDDGFFQKFRSIFYDI